MRPLRFLLSLATCFSAITLLLYISLPSRQPTFATSHSNEESGQLRSMLSFHSPSSLFQPSAIISLTDDNSTFFLARPAAFGPLLPSKGLSGPLWIGSGFGDEKTSDSGPGSSVEGELGCGDVPGWYATGRKNTAEELGDSDVESLKSTKKTKAKSSESGKDGAGGFDPLADDGTDDLLPRTSSSHLKGTKSELADHADIESLQQTAEIAGKVVLLRRGGCGFLEKVKWAQRRGGVAVIVGDDVRGGPLVTMYARGDTSNVTIPSLFTSRTTAHLLSSLYPATSFSSVLSSKDRTSGSKAASGTDRGYDKADKDATPLREVLPVEGSLASDDANEQEKGWLHSTLAFFGLTRGSRPGAKSHADGRPNKGSADWIMVEDWEESDRSMREKKEMDRSGKKISDSSDKAAKGGFIIGVHDWRDPDLVAAEIEDDMDSGVEKSHQLPDTDAGPERVSEYSSGSYDSTDTRNREYEGRKEAQGWWDRVLKFLRLRSNRSAKSYKAPPSRFDSSYLAHDYDAKSEHVEEPSQHEGLWVTLTPASMSSSPFFDTLLVLVVSPLVTLTVVYALLLLRSRIRQRRWRAPKSVVDRLPVRTYHTLPSHANSADQTSATASGMATPISPSASTPLLQQVGVASSRTSHRSRHQSEAHRQRVRSHTVSAVTSHHNPLADDPDDASITTPTRSSNGQNADESVASEQRGISTAESEHEKREAGLAEWRRRYGGRQRECVVCLEEYVDGVSRVMSLPCGHEFHAECITPWLTTRRRTCPICKGDVVRSMAASNDSARASSSLPISAASWTTARSSQRRDHQASNVSSASRAGSYTATPTATTTSSSLPSHHFSAASLNHSTLSADPQSLSSSASTSTIRQPDFTTTVSTSGLISRSSSTDRTQTLAALSRNDGPNAHSPVPFYHDHDPDALVGDEGDDDEAHGLVADLERAAYGSSYGRRESRRASSGLAQSLGATTSGWIRGLFGGAHGNGVRENDVRGGGEEQEEREVLDRDR